MAKSKKPETAIDNDEHGVESPKATENLNSTDKPEDADTTSDTAEKTPPNGDAPGADMPIKTELDDGGSSKDLLDQSSVADDQAHEKEGAEEQSLDLDAQDDDDPEKTADNDGGQPDEDTKPTEDSLSGEVLVSENVEKDSASQDPPWGKSDTSEAVASEDVKAASDTTIVPQPETKIVRGGMWPAVFGGVIAALVGFIAGRGDMLEQYLPASMQRPSFDTAAIEAETAAIGAESAAIRAETAAIVAETEAIAAQTVAQAERLETLEAAIEASSSDTGVSDSVAALAADLAVATDRLTALEHRPVAPVIEGASTETVNALQTELDAQNAQIAALVARAEEAEAKAQSEAMRLLARAALARVMVAVDSGEAFTLALTDLEEVTPVEVPDALRNAAQEGVPTLNALQESFPDAARSGLAAARASVPESEVEGLGEFLKRQLNLRSVTPREGDDPDAVLSRAQAAIGNGDLGTALTEMEALPEAARSAMNDWLEAASARKAAQDAANALADSLNSN